MTIRTTLPRLQIRKEDQKEGQYPTVARTGDKQRSGTSKKFFDDTKTVVYQSNVTISYPTTYKVGSSRIETDLSSTIQAIGNVIPNASEQFNSYEPDLIPTPFSEGSSDLEQSSTDPFFLTGTSLSDLGYYFNSKLADKTKIVIEVPITSEFQMLSQSVGCYYYNKSTQTFDIIKQSRGEVFGADFITLTADITPDSTLFDPFGKYSIKPEPGDSTFSNFSLKNNQFFANPSGSYLASASSNPTSNNLILMDSYLNQPFLVEKAVLEMPFAAGPGWLMDQTKYGVSTDTGMTVYPIYDVGGPAITFGLLSYHGGNVKSIIMSGSLVPKFDATAYLSQSYTYASPGNTGSFYTHPAGFNFFGRPAGIINNVDTFFTGTAILKMTAQASSGYRSVDTVPEKNYNTLRNYATSRVQGSDIIGRTKQGDINNVVGRSLFGKDISSPQYPKSIIQPTRIDLWETASYTPGHNTIVHYQIEQYTNSPYLLNPKDNIVLSLSKYRPVWNSSSFTGVGEYGGRTYYSSKSHDVKVATGTLRLTLYGSLVKEDKEFHDTVNQQLDTVEVHEFIGAEPITDQFDLFYPQEFSGSYIDRFKMGTFLTNAAMTGSSERNRLWSNFTNTNAQSLSFLTGNLEFVKTRKAYEYAQRNRNAQFFSTNEKYYDSMHPKLSDLFVATNYQFFQYSALSPVVTYLLGVTSVVLQNKHIRMGYLFQPLFSKAIRTSSELDTFALPDGIYPNQMTSVTTNYSKLFVADFGFNWYDSVGSGIEDSDEAKKIIFGFSNRIDTNSIQATPTDLLYGVTGGVRRRKLKVSGMQGLSIGADISGWKYGLISALPTYSKIVFRRDRFGQPRDMLEQRLDTKYYDTVGVLEDGSSGGQIGTRTSPVQVRFVDSSGKTTDPARTWSSNLSTEVTSSLPYFDGQVRNREEPIDISSLNSSNITVLS